MMVQLRQTAYKVWILDLINGRYIKEKGEWDPNYVLVRDNLKVSRVNIVASIVNKYVNEDGSYSYLTVDDGSADINVKAWREDVKIFDKCDVGDLIALVGRVKEFSNEKYIVPEVIKKLDNVNWAKVRKLELEKEFGKALKIKKEDIPEDKIEIEVKNLGSGGIVVREERAEVITQTNRQKILEFISRKDKVNYDEVIEELKISEKEVEAIIKELLREGEIYQPKPNYLKVI